MKRTLTYSIGADTAGWSILAFLKQKQFSHSVITQLKKTECGIMVNGVWAYVSRILQEGEVLSIHLVEDCPADESRTLILPEGQPLEAVYEDEDLLVVNKPASMPVHPSMEHYDGTLADAVLRHAQAEQEWYPYRCINRLDRDTSGLVLIAKNAYSSCILYGQMRNRSIFRTYYAIAEGLTADCGTISAPISRREDSIIERTVDFAGGKKAVTHYRRLAYKDGLSLLKLHLETGRTHQIRVHMRHIGHPLIGDFLYNPKDSRMKRQALHAGNLEFTHPLTSRTLHLYAPMPEDMLQFFHMVIS